MSTEFLKIAADFYGGKEVLTEAEYETKPPPSELRTRTFTVTNDCLRYSDAVFEMCKKSPAAFVLLRDILRSNQMDIAAEKQEKAHWLGLGPNTTVHLETIGTSSRNVGENEVRNYLLSKHGKQPSQEEEENSDSDTSTPAQDSSLLDYLLSKHGKQPTREDEEDSEIGTSTPAQFEPNSDAKRKKEDQAGELDVSELAQCGLKITLVDTQDHENSNHENENHENKNHERNDHQEKHHDQVEDEEWMKASKDQGQDTGKTPTRSPKKSKNARNKPNNKKSKNRNKSNTNKPPQAGLGLGALNDEDLAATEEPNISAKEPVSQSLNSFDSPSSEDKSGGWNIVQNRIPARQAPASNVSTGPNRGSTRNQTGIASRSTVPLPHQVSFSQYSVEVSVKLILLKGKKEAIQTPMLTTSRGQPRTQAGRSIGIPKGDTIQKPPTGMKADSAPAQIVAGNKSARKVAKKAIPSKSEKSRIFIPEEYPALSATASASAEPPGHNPAQELTPTTPTQVQKSSPSLHPPQSPGLSAKAEPEAKSVATSPSMMYTEAAGADFETTDFEKSSFEMSSQTLPKLEIIDIPTDVEPSEQSSTTVQGDISQPSDILMTVGYEPSKESGDNDLLASHNRSGDQEVSLTAAERDDGYTAKENEEIESESTEAESDSDIEIITSPSQLRNREKTGFKTFKSDTAGGIEEMSGRGSSDDFPPQSPSRSFLDSKGRVADNRHCTTHDFGGSTGLQSAGKSPQASNQATAASAPEDSITISGLSLQSMNTAISSPSRLLITEDEAFRVVTTQKIVIRSARYSPGDGVAIPNYYCEWEDAESDTEKVALKLKSIDTVGKPSVHSTTHSATTGVTIPNSFCVPEGDASEGTEEITQNGTDVADQDVASDHNDSSHSSSVMDANLFSLSLVHDKYGEQPASHPSTAAPGACDAQPSIDTDNEAISKVSPKVESPSTVMNATFPTSDSNQTHGNVVFNYAESASKPSSLANGDRRSSGPVEAPLPLYNSGLSDAHNFSQGPPLFSASHSTPPTNLYSGFSSDGESSQTISHQQHIPHDQSRDEHTAGSSSGFQGTDTFRSTNQMGFAGQNLQPMSQLTAMCTYCEERTTPSVESRQVLCHGCGPNTNIRYCSVACLLVDALNHAHRCVNYAAGDRAAYYNLPASHFIYIINPIMPMLDYLPETPERFRQKVFSMYCSSGPFPKLLMAWMKKANVVYPSHWQNMDLSEMAKRSGDYAVFRSNAVTGPVPQNNPNADVIFT
jgi:hypothetical protein